jgi:hypothetical protein
MVLALAVAAQADQVVISEIMYHPRADWPEFIEVFNNTATVFDVAGWKLSGGVQYEFPDFSPADPAASLLHSFERIVLSEAGPEATRTGLSSSGNHAHLRTWKGKLKNGEERITLRDQNGTRVTTVRYGDRGLWSPPQTARTLPGVAGSEPVSRRLAQLEGERAPRRHARPGTGAVTGNPRGLAGNRSSARHNPPRLFRDLALRRTRHQSGPALARAGLR